MKKINLLFALLFILSIGLQSCGGDDDNGSSTPNCTYSDTVVRIDDNTDYRVVNAKLNVTDNNAGGQKFTFTINSISTNCQNTQKLVLSVEKVNGQTAAGTYPVTFSDEDYNSAYGSFEVLNVGTGNSTSEDLGSGQVTITGQGGNNYTIDLYDGSHSLFDSYVVTTQFTIE